MISGCSVQPPGAVPGRTYPRTSTTPYPDYGPAWVAECYGIIPDTMRGDLALTLDQPLTVILDDPDEVAMAWQRVLSPGGVTAESMLDDGHI